MAKTGYITKAEAKARVLSSPWLTMNEAAGYLGVHPTTIIDWVDAGRLTRYVVQGGRATRYRRDDLDALMQPQEQEKPNDAA